MSRPPASSPPFRRSTDACALVVLAIGCLVLFGGWVLDVSALKSVIPGTVGMKASTASALASLAASLLLLRDPDASGARRAAGRLCALFPLAVGLAVLGEYVLGWNLHIDELPFRDEIGRAQGIAYPGRLAPTTAVNLVLAGAAVLVLDVRPRWGWRPAEVLVLPVAVVASMSLIGYTYAIPAFYGPGSAAKMAVNTAACFVLVAGSILFSRPHGRLLFLATTSSPGGLMARRLIPVVVVMPLLLGWIRLELSDAGLFADRVGTWWLTATTIVGMVLLVWRGAVELNAADADRRKLEQRLHDLATHDQMSGMFNRHRFEEEMALHAARVRRHSGSTALLVIDLDGLKQVNDQLGHAAGDDLIKAVARAIASRVRGSDVAARLGGDEFGVLLVESTSEGALNAAEGTLAAIRAAGRGSDGAWSTASIGVAHATQLWDQDGHALLAQADEAMYQAKRAGGDRVVYSGLAQDAPQAA